MQGQPLVLGRYLESTNLTLIHKTNKYRRGTARHLNNKCCSPNNKHAYLGLQIIGQVFNNNQFSIEDLLWKREKHWQAQLFTNLDGMNNINDLYSRKRKEYRKQQF